MSIRYSISCGLLAVLLSACASTPSEKPEAAAVEAAPPATAAQAPATAKAPGAPAVASAPGAPPPARATAEFNRAIGFMRSGNATEAELEFKQMTLSYPT